VREKIEQVIKELEELESASERLASMSIDDYDVGRHAGRSNAYRIAITKLNAIIAEDRTAEAEETRCRG